MEECLADRADPPIDMPPCGAISKPPCGLVEVPPCDAISKSPCGLDRSLCEESLYELVSKPLYEESLCENCYVENRYTNKYLANRADPPIK